MFDSIETTVWTGCLFVSYRFNMRERWGHFLFFAVCPIDQSIELTSSRYIFSTIPRQCSPMRSIYKENVPMCGRLRSAQIRSKIVQEWIMNVVSYPSFRKFIKIFHVIWAFGVVYRLSFYDSQSVFLCSRHTETITRTIKSYFGSSFILCRLLCG